MSLFIQHTKNVALDNVIGYSCLQCGNTYETRDDVIEANPRIISTEPWAYVDDECFSGWVNQSYNNNIKLEKILEVFHKQPSIVIQWNKTKTQYSWQYILTAKGEEMLHEILRILMGEE